MDEFVSWREIVKAADEEELLRLRRDFSNIRLANIAGYEHGVRMKWWEDYDMHGPIPFPKTFTLSHFGEGATLANVVVEIGLFPSITQARKNGFVDPLTVGDFAFTKKKIRVRITE